MTSLTDKLNSLSEDRQERILDIAKGLITMYGWGTYRKKGTAELRPYIKGEDLSGISVSEPDDPETDMGMIARNADNHDDQWYVARQWFEDHYEPVESLLEIMEGAAG